jgi:hypothetical protein
MDGTRITALLLDEVATFNAQVNQPQIGASVSYDAIVHACRAGADIAPPKFDRVKLTREQVAAIPRAHPDGFGTTTVDLLGIPLDLVADITESTPYLLAADPMARALGFGSREG